LLSHVLQDIDAERADEVGSSAQHPHDVLYAYAELAQERPQLLHKRTIGSRDHLVLHLLHPNCISFDFSLYEMGGNKVTAGTNNVASIGIIYVR
jgi:hypothetical protein